MVLVRTCKRCLKDLSDPVSSSVQWGVEAGFLFIPWLYDSVKVVALGSEMTPKKGRKEEEEGRAPEGRRGGGEMMKRGRCRRV